MTVTYTHVALAHDEEEAAAAVVKCSDGDYDWDRTYTTRVTPMTEYPPDHDDSSFVWNGNSVPDRDSDEMVSLGRCIDKGFAPALAVPRCGHNHCSVGPDNALLDGKVCRPSEFWARLGAQEFVTSEGNVGWSPSEVQLSVAADGRSFVSPNGVVVSPSARLRLLGAVAWFDPEGADRHPHWRWTKDPSLQPGQRDSTASLSPMVPR